MLKFWLASVCLVVVSMLGVPTSRALTAEQAAHVTVVESYLKRVEDNLKLALESAGSGDGVPTGSKAKLTKLRLDEAAAYLPLAKDELKDLPADDAQIKPLQSRYDTAAASVQQLYDRLAGKNPPAAAEEKPAEAKDDKPAAPGPPGPGGPGAAPAQGGTKLDYRQVDQLKAAQFNLREVEGEVNKLIKLHAELLPAEDQNTIDHRVVVGAMTTLANANRKAGFTAEGLKPLPADGAGVAETRARLDAANESLAGSAAFFTPLQAKLMKLIDPATYPEVEADIKKMRELSAMYYNADLLQTDIPQAVAILQQKDAAMGEVKRIAVLYGPLINQGTELSKQIEGTGNGFLQNYNRFLQAADAMKETLPDAVRKHLAEANGYADEAVAKQNVRYFTGAIPQAMGFADDKLLLLQTLDPEAGKKLDAEVAQSKAQIATRQKSLQELIIQETKVPADVYAGDDKTKLAEVAVSGWKVQQPDAEVLGVYFPIEQWKRTTRWEYWRGTWTYVDYSRLQVHLVVKQDDKLAIIRPVNLQKDHQQADQVIGLPLHSIDDELIPQDYLLRSKIK